MLIELHQSEEQLGSTKMYSQEFLYGGWVNSSWTNSNYKLCNGTKAFGRIIKKTLYKTVS